VADVTSPIGHHI